MPEASDASPVFRQRSPGAAEDREQLRDLAVGHMQRSGLPGEVRLRWGGVALVAISGKYGEDGLSQQGMAARLLTRVPT